VVDPFSDKYSCILLYHHKEQFLLENAHWVLEKLEQFRTAYVDLPRYTTKDYQQNKQRALQFVRQKVQEFNRWYGYKVNNISVKNQKTRWGSCSGKGNLNFNYKILFLPEDVASYIIVHELCHLREFNHSRKFWELVALSFPDYLEIRKDIKKLCISGF